MPLPTIYQRCGVYLDRAEPERRPLEDRDRYRTRLIAANEHLADGNGILIDEITIRLAVHIDSTMPPDLCSETGTIPIAPRPLPMWVGSFALQTLPRTF